MNQEIATGKSFFWNTVGSALNAFTSFVLLAFVTRNVDANEASYFSIAFASAQLLLSFGKFGVRAFQATDVRGVVSYRAFVLNRALTSVAMMALSILYAFFSGYSIHKALVVVLVCGIKVVDAVEDVFHGELQLNEQIDIAGKLLTLRNLFTIVCFGIMIFCSHSLIITCMVTALFSMLFCVLINQHAIKKINHQKQIYQKEQIFIIFRQCFPLFAGSFLSILVYNMPKYAIDSLAMEQIQTIYNIIFMPAFAINMMSEFIFKPLLTPLAHYWTEGNLNRLKQIIIRLLLGIAVITVAVLLGGFIAGIPILEIVYIIPLTAYKGELMLLLLGGGFSATVYLSYNLLTMMRKQKFVFPGYLGGVIIAGIISWDLVEKYGITGAAWTYLSVEVLMSVYFLGAISMMIKKRAGKC